MQASGGRRGVNRTAGNPGRGVPGPRRYRRAGQTVDEVIDLADIEPDAIDHMIARGLVPQMPTDAGQALPGPVPVEEAAKKHTSAPACGRDEARGPRLGTWPYRDISIKRCHQPPCVALRFQPAGRGQLPRFCIVDLVKVPDPRAALEAALGPLALFEVLTGPEPAAEAAE